MPEKEVAKFSIKYLQVLDEHGKVDKKLEPKIANNVLIQMYTNMLRARMFDQKCIKMQRQGRMGTFAPVTGQEACQVGPCTALNKTDWFVPAFRELAGFLTRGASMKNIAIVMMGNEIGGQGPKGSRDLNTAVPVASQTLHAVGLAHAMKYKNENSAALCFFGDGATSEGDFYEALNWAGVYSLPVIFFNQNNQWAISLPRKEQTHAETLAQKAIAGGIEGLQVDGNDILGCYVATKRALDKAKKGKGPTLIEGLTYRMEMHTTADDPKKYRSEKEVKEWAKKDPILRFEKYLTHKKLLNTKKIKKIQEEAQKEIDQAMKDAEAAPLPTLKDMFQYIYAEMDPYLEEQLAGLKVLKDHKDAEEKAKKPEDKPKHELEAQSKQRLDVRQGKALTAPPKKEDLKQHARTL